MGNCQAAEAATVVIHHPAENKVERIYWSVTASDVMGSNPGHYVAMIMTSPSLKNDNGSPLKQLKLLRPDDTLLIGHVYRLVSFEDVLKEFAAKKCVKLGKLLKDKGGLELKQKKKKKESGGLSDQDPNPNPYLKPNHSGSLKVRLAVEGRESDGVDTATTTTTTTITTGIGGCTRRHHQGGGGGGGGRGQWRPALQSIEEFGT